jgi:hypothetical protein
MGTIEDARKWRKKYKRILDNARWNATLRKFPDAGHAYIQKINEYYQGLKDMGYRQTDEYEPGRTGRLVPITKEWVTAQRAKMSEVDRLMEAARHAGPNADGAELINKALRKLNGE